MVLFLGLRREYDSEAQSLLWVFLYKQTTTNVARYSYQRGFEVKIPNASWREEYP